MKNDPDYDPDIVRPLFDDNVTERARCCAGAPKPAPSGTWRGFGANRGACGTLKYRCPAAAFGFECAGRKECHRAASCQAGEYVVRVDLEKHDRRIFTPWGSPSWKRSRRSAADLQPGRVPHGEAPVVCSKCGSASRQSS